jgi:uncharacterized membrane protein YhaH (DUF805 family)
MILLVRKFFLGIVCFSILMVAILVFFAFLSDFKNIMGDANLEICLKFLYVFVLFVSFTTVIGWAITSAYLLGVIK